MGVVEKAFEAFDRWVSPGGSPGFDYPPSPGPSNKTPANMALGADRPNMPPHSPRTAADGPDPMADLSDTDLKGLAHMLGYSDKDLAIKDIREELCKLYNAGGIDPSNKDNFVDYWDNVGYVKTPKADAENARKQRYMNYEFMIQNSPSVALANKAFVDEVLSAIRDDDDFFVVKVYNHDGTFDRENTGWLNDAMTGAGLFSDPRMMASQLVMYGDSFWRIDKIKPQTPKDGSPPENVPDMTEFDEDGKDVEAYQVIDPLLVQRVNLMNKDIPLKFVQKSAENGRGKDVAPWDLIHYRLACTRKDIRPYGESLFEAVRGAYRRLVIIEALLAMTRASKVERLIIGVPTNSDNPDLMITKLIRFKNLFKNIILGNAASLTTEKKNIAFTDILYVPKGKDEQTSFTIDKLQASLDMSSPEDAEYFKDDVINGLQLPRGYLKSDDAYQGYRKLALQDLRFARAVNTVLRAMAEGHTLFAKIVMFRAGRLGDKEIKISYTPPAPIAGEQLDAIGRALDMISKIMDIVDKVLADEPQAGDTGDTTNINVSPPPGGGEFPLPEEPEGEVPPEEAPPEIAPAPGVTASIRTEAVGISKVKMIRALLIKFARFPKKIVDQILPEPMEGTARSQKVQTNRDIRVATGGVEVTREELKARAMAAFASSPDEECVSSKDIKFLNWTQAKSKKQATYTESMYI